MRKTRERTEERPPETPAWIVSYTDMTTLLLAFFVLLQAFAKERSPDLFYEGQGSFKRAIAGLGLPAWLFGQEEKLRGEVRKRKYPAEEDKHEVTRSRVLDVEDERIRTIFQELKRQIDTRTSDVSAKSINVLITPIRFRRSEASLDEAARSYLRDLAMNLRQNLNAGAVRIYVVGMAADDPPGMERWITSARRAKAAEDFLRLALSGEAGRPWRLSSWGAGAGAGRQPAAPADMQFIRVSVVKTE